MERRSLKLSRDRKLAGVCGGFADYFGWEPHRMRVVYSLLTLITGIVGGLVLYTILAFVLPGPDHRPPGSFDLDDFRQQ